MALTVFLWKLLPLAPTARHCLLFMPSLPSVKIIGFMPYPVSNYQTTLQQMLKRTFNWALPETPDQMQKGTSDRTSHRTVDRASNQTLE